MKFCSHTLYRRYSSCLVLFIFITSTTRDTEYLAASSCYADDGGLAKLADIAGFCIYPSLRPDSDFDSVGDALEPITGTDPINPDSDNDLAVDSIDPLPLVFNTNNVLTCCTNTWLFHVHNGLATDITNCLLAVNAEAWFADRFPVTVTLKADVPPPGAVLRIGPAPLLLRKPGTWTLWLPWSTPQYVYLCRPLDFPLSYKLSSSDSNFIFEPGGKHVPQTLPDSGIRYEGAMAVPCPITIIPRKACFHGRPITFKAKGCMTGLSGIYTWKYGNTIVVTNAPFATFAPNRNAPTNINVSFMPDLAREALDKKHLPLCAKPKKDK